MLEKVYLAEARARAVSRVDVALGPAPCGRDTQSQGHIRHTRHQLCKKQHSHLFMLSMRKISSTHYTGSLGKGEIVPKLNAILSQHEIYALTYEVDINYQLK